MRLLLRLTPARAAVKRRTQGAHRHLRITPPPARRLQALHRPPLRRIVQMRTHRIQVVNRHPCRRRKRTANPCKIAVIQGFRQSASQCGGRGRR